MQVGAAQKEVREGTIGDDQAVARHADAPLDREEAVAQHAPLSTPRPRPEPHDHLVSWSRERRASVGRSVGGESGIRTMDWACSVQHRRKVRYLLSPAVCKVISKRERWHVQRYRISAFFLRHNTHFNFTHFNFACHKHKVCTCPSLLRCSELFFLARSPAALESTSVTSAEKLTG